MSSIDVVVPCYKYAHYLDYCVGTILAQRDVDVRVLIVDDVSPDNTPEVGMRLAARDGRVTYMRNEVNKGLIGTANYGVMEWATAPYTLLLSADDALTPGALTRAVYVLDSHPEAGMVYGMARIIDGNERPFEGPDPTVTTYQIVDGPRFLEFSCRVGNPVSTPTAIVRTKLLQDFGGYCAKFPFTSDMELWMRLAIHGSIGVIKDLQGYYRWHGGNMAHQFIGGALSDRRERLKTCLHIAKENGASQIAAFKDGLDEMKRNFSIEAMQFAEEAVTQGKLDVYRECVAFAQELNPGLRGSAGWWRLQAKQALGSTVTRGLGKLAHRLRPSQEVVGADHPVSNWRHGSKFGWWPEGGQREA